MRTIKLSDLDLLEVGHTIQLYGAIYSGPKGLLYYLPLPDEDAEDLQASLNVGMSGGEMMLTMDLGEWEVFLKQTDVLDIKGPGKAILRKSQRQIDQNISWAVFRRAGYACRYCGRCDVPLTVDHIILWEDGGATTEDNLLSACRRCNKLRGSMQYDQWLQSRQYAGVVTTGCEYDPRMATWRNDNNYKHVADMPRLRSLSVVKQRSR